MIYRYYFSEESGYCFDFESRKLRASNRPIDLALLYTSRQIAAETQGLAFEVNTITFSTACPKSRPERLRAGRYDRIMHELRLAKIRAVASTGHRDLRHFRTPETIVQLSQQWECYAADFKWLDVRVDEERVWGTAFEKIPGQLPTESSWGEACSKHLGFVDHALKLFSDHPNFVGDLAKCDATKQQAFVRSRWLFSSPDPWSIPTEDELSELEHLLAPRWVKPYAIFHRRNSDEVDEFWKMILWRYSACAIAIAFLQSLSATMRLNMRKIVLDEDLGSVCRPECHALGLISFCSENPALYIERRVNLWRNAFPANSGISVYDIFTPPSPEDQVYFYDSPDYITTYRISNSLRDWLTEALALSAAGMPAQSFTLVFDGNPAPAQSSALFEIVKWDATWQTAYDQWERSRPRPLTYQYWRRMKDWDCRPKVHKFDAFPQTILDITTGKSFISCNFPMGEPWELEEAASRILESHITHSKASEWTDSQSQSYARFSGLLDVPASRNFKEISTVPPLPPFREIRLSEICQEEPGTQEEEDSMP